MSDNQPTAFGVSEEMRTALRTALDHIEHMAKWIGQHQHGYSFESLGEDMPGMRAALSAKPAQPIATDLPGLGIIDHLKMDQVCPHCGKTPSEGPQPIPTPDEALVPASLLSHMMPNPTKHAEKLYSRDQMLNYGERIRNATLAALRRLSQREADSAPAQTDTARERALEERNTLENSMGRGSFADGAARDRIAEIDAALLSPDRAPGQTHEDRLREMEEMRAGLQDLSQRHRSPAQGGNGELVKELRGGICGLITAIGVITGQDTGTDRKRLGEKLDGLYNTCLRAADRLSRQGNVP